MRREAGTNHTYWTAAWCVKLDWTYLHLFDLILERPKVENCGLQSWEEDEIEICIHYWSIQKYLWRTRAKKGVVTSKFRSRSLWIFKWYKDVVSSLGNEILEINNVENYMRDFWLRMMLSLLWWRKHLSLYLTHCSSKYPVNDFGKRMLAQVGHTLIRTALIDPFSALTALWSLPSKKKRTIWFIRDTFEADEIVATKSLR